MYAIYGNIYHQYTPNVSIYPIHGSYGLELPLCVADESKKTRTHPWHPWSIGYIHMDSLIVKSPGNFVQLRCLNHMKIIRSFIIMIMMVKSC